MKKQLTHLIIGLGLTGSAIAQSLITGPSTTNTPYMRATTPNGSVTSILTAGDAIGGYKMCGLGDGMGAFDNGGNTFTLLINHEMGTTAGTVHAHGSTGAFISKWVINKSNFQVVSGADLIQNVKLWTGTTYTTYNSTSPSTLTAFGRFCAADLPVVNAFYNPWTGNGTQNRIFMNGEESGAEGRGFAHIVTGSEAGTSYQVPFLGRYSYENSVPSPYPNEKTIVVGLDDATPGQVYVYIGIKSNAGNDIEKAGLHGGKLYGVAVLGMANEQSSSIPSAGTTFNLIDLGTVQNMSGATLQTNSNNAGVTNFLRPEDGAWDPNMPTDFYFVTTNSFTSPSRMWRLRFNDINNPEFGGTVTCVLDGTEGAKMMDNMVMDNHGNAFIQEDPGGQAHHAKVWKYNIAMDALTLVMDQDSARFTTGGANFLTIDEESSGIIDMQGMMNAGWFLLYDQAHYSIPGEVAEGGQLMAYYNAQTASADPEINITGNGVSIPAGNSTTSSGNNTSFGLSNVGTSVIKPFVIHNAGPGSLILTHVQLVGANAADFSVLNASVFPMTLAANASYTFNVQFTPTAATTSTANIRVMSSDYDEHLYFYAIEGAGAVPEINLTGNNQAIIDGNTTTSVNDNTDFGSIFYNASASRTFEIQNTGNGTLTINNIVVSGLNASEFSIQGPATPAALTGSTTQVFTITLQPAYPGTKTAVVAVSNTDSNESVYDFVISGVALMDVSISEAPSQNSSVLVYPNPTRENATLKFNLEKNENVAITIFDINGKIVFNKSLNNLTAGTQEIALETSTLKNGNYFVNLKTGNKISVVKLVVSH